MRNESPTMNELIGCCREKFKKEIKRRTLLENIIVLSQVLEKEEREKIRRELWKELHPGEKKLMKRLLLQLKSY